MAELGQQTVDFSALVGRAADESFISLKELVEKAKSPELSDTDKKIILLKYIVKTQQRMLRLNALAKWCRQVPLINSCQDLGSSLSSHDICFTQAADSLFFMHEGLQKELLRSARVCRGPSDVFLQAFLDEPSTVGGDMVGSEEQVEPEVLRVEPMDLQLL